MSNVRNASYIESGILTADSLIYTGEALVYSITIAWKNATVGEHCNLRDGVTVAGAVEVMFVYPTANGTITKEWPKGKLFNTGIYFNKGATAGGEVYAELTYQPTI
jgi:hypothetical protein